MTLPGSRKRRVAIHEGLGAGRFSKLALGCRVINLNDFFPAVSIAGIGHSRSYCNSFILCLPNSLCVKGRIA